MHNHKTLRTLGQFNLCHDNSDNTQVYYVENTLLTKYTKGKGVSYTFGEEKKQRLMQMSNSEFLKAAKQKAGNNISGFEVAQNLWATLGDVPVSVEGILEADWENEFNCTFVKGTDREEVWSWFEDYFDLSVTKLMFPNSSQEQ